MQNPDPDLLAKPAWSINRLMDAFDMSRTKVYDLISDGTFIG